MVNIFDTLEQANQVRVPNARVQDLKAGDQVLYISGLNGIARVGTVGEANSECFIFEGERIVQWVSGGDAIHILGEQQPLPVVTFPCIHATRIGGENGDWVLQVDADGDWKVLARSEHTATHRIYFYPDEIQRFNVLRPDEVEAKIAEIQAIKP